MSPSFPAARPYWVWSLPAFAIILSILWSRRNRGSSKTDSGGAGETQDDQKSVESDEEATAPRKSEISGVLTKSDSGREEIDEIVEKVTLNLSAQTVAPVVEENFPERDSVETKEDFHANNTERDLKDEEVIKVIQEEKESAISQSGEVAESVDREKEKAALSRQRKDIEIAENKVQHFQKRKEIREIVSIEESVILGKEDIDSSKVKCCKKEKMKNSSKKSSESNSETRQNKEENTASILEKKLVKLELGSQCNNNNGEENRGSEDLTERDSANNSPSEVMLASPSVSGYSETHSEGSSDSGKGCSEMLTPSRTPASGNSVSGDLPVTSIYEFVIPQQLVGRLIGRYGSYVNEIKETTHASIYIKRHPETSKLKICAVEGTQMDIESALDMIRHKFPKKRYPNVTLEQVVLASEPQLIPIISESMQLYLIEGINNDVLLSSLVSAGHFFLQQPTHPTYLSLSHLNSCMNYCYSEPDQPTIPDGVGAGILCAAPVHNGWYRAQITSMDPDSKICDVKFVDYGGYMTMPVSMLRQIRVDFVNLPFQAAECYLASVKPANEENVWCDKAKKLVEELTFGKVLQAQVYGYAEDGIPLIYLYTVNDDKVILINEELVNLGLAEWIYIEMDEIVENGNDEEKDDKAQSAPMAVAI